MDKPKISVIVPVYNVEKYLHRCIDSILSQTFTDFELLLIDDGSTDSSGKICDEYEKKDERIRVFHKENGGVSSARNLGLRKASFYWIAFCDSDDYVEKDWLMSFNPDETSNSLKMQGCQFLVNKDIVQKETPNKSIKGKKEILNEIISLENKGITIFRAPWSKLYVNDIIKQNNILFDETMSLGEDYLFALYYLKSIDSFELINAKNYIYVSDNSTLNKKTYAIKVLISWAEKFRICAADLSIQTNNEFYSFIMYGQFMLLLRRAFRRPCPFSEQRAAVKYYQRTTTREIDKYINYPYRTISILRRLPITINTFIFSILFKILSIIK